MTVYKNGKEIEKKSLVFRDGKEIGTDDLNLPRINVRGILFSFERSVTVAFSKSSSKGCGLYPAIPNAVFCT